MSSEDSKNKIKPKDSESESSNQSPALDIKQVGKQKANRESEYDSGGSGGAKKSPRAKKHIKNLTDSQSESDRSNQNSEPDPFRTVKHSKTSIVKPEISN